MKQPVCPLCSSLIIETYRLEAFGRSFYYCTECTLISATPQSLPANDDEKTRYENHQNNIEDEGYVKFLNQAIEPALKYLNSSSRILDFGCGPEPVLSQVLALKDFECDNYDPYFHPELPTKKYDVIFSTEVFEHFHDPKKEIEILTQLLAPNGVLVVMTEFYKNRDQFKNWWYTRDFTHVSFYSEPTFQYIAKRFGFSIEYTDHNRVIILSRP